MRTYTVKKISGAPNWDTVEKLPIDQLLWTDSCDIQAWSAIDSATPEFHRPQDFGMLILGE